MSYYDSVPIYILYGSTYLRRFPLDYRIDFDLNKKCICLNISTYLSRYVIIMYSHVNDFMGIYINHYYKYEVELL